MIKLLDIPNMHRELRINLIENLHLLVNEIEAAQQRISREIIEESTIGEVEDARDGEERLNDRLRKDFGSLQADLNDIGVAQINKNKGKFDQTYLSDSLLEQITGGADVNATPANFSTTTIKLEDDAVTIDTADFIEQSTNLFNVHRATSNKIVSLDGTVSDSSSYSVGPFIRVKPNTDYFFFGIYSIARYDENQVFMNRSSLDPNGDTFTTPSDCYYVRLNYRHEDTSTYKNNWKMNLGSEKSFEHWYARLKSEVEAKALIFDVVGRDNIKEQAVFPEKTSFIKRSTNLFNKDTVRELTNIDPKDGSDFKSLTYNSSEYIRVTPGKDYTFYGFVSLGTFGKNKGFVNREYIDASGETVTMPDDIYYIRVQYQPNASYSNHRINEGSTLLEFEEYYHEFERGLELEPLNEVVQQSKDRIMFDMPIDGTFGTSENFGDHADFNNTTSAEVYTMFDDLMNSFPDYISKNPLGDDEWGNSIAAYYFTPSQPDADIETKQAKVFITCGVHGYEHMSTLATYYLMKQLCENWEADGLLEALRFNVEFIIIPVCNPSGWDAYERHNGNDVDINRNFPAGWRSSAGNAGAEPSSELETQYIQSVFDNNEDIDIMLDFHNFHEGSNGDYFLWIPAPNAYLQHMAQNLFSRMTRKWRKDFSFIPSSDYFAGYASTGATGTTSTYARKRGVKYSTTFEICNKWMLDPNTESNDANVSKAGVEALANWLLINLQEAK